MKAKDLPKNIKGHTAIVEWEDTGIKKYLIVGRYDRNTVAGLEWGPKQKRSAHGVHHLIVEIDNSQIKKISKRPIKIFR